MDILAPRANNNVAYIHMRRLSDNKIDGIFSIITQQKGSKFIIKLCTI